MKIGIFPACLGKKDAGPETYERELLTAIAAAPGPKSTNPQIHK